ncbi:MAG TPA: FUSC family protein [Bryobacteraceae bacterium]|nr:FUSC family protein [Bryobacteraceae bacterium]
MMQQTTEANAAAVQTTNRWRIFWRTVTKFDRGKIIPLIALRNALGVGIPLAAGILTGYKLSGLAIATGALNVAFSDGNDSYPQRARRMLAASILVAVAVFIGALSGSHHMAAVSIAAVWAFAAGLAVCLGTTPGDLGVISLVTLVVYSAQSLSPVNAAWSSVLALGGGLFQTLLAVLFWPVRRYQPERRALGNLYLELARVASNSAGQETAPPASEASTHAQQMLSNLDRDHKLEGERYRSLLNQAERIRLALLTLGRLHRRLSREGSAGDPLHALDGMFESAGDLLYAIGSSLTRNESLDIARRDLRAFSEWTAALRNYATGRLTPFVRALLADAQLQVDALAGQFRAALELAEHATPEGSITFAKADSSRPMSLRVTSAMAILRANLTLNSTACRHAIRLAVCLGAGDLGGRLLDWRRSYWLPMTIAIVLKPDFTSTFSRGVLRLAGTFAGLALATVLLHFIHPSAMGQVLVITFFMFALRSVGSANYGILVVSVSGLVVFLVGLTGIAAGSVISARAINTTVGGLLALVAYWLWPTWERMQVGEQFARMIDAYRGYLQTIVEVYTSEAGVDVEKLAHARLAARLARSNAVASVDRLGAEPGMTAEQVGIAASMLASSHRFVYALMALDSGLASSTPIPPREAFRQFVFDLDLTLYLLAAALRGSPFSKKKLPDLRADHMKLLESGDPAAERHALVNVETDRLTNSVNTLREQIALMLKPRGSTGAAQEPETLRHVQLQ